MRLGSGPLKIKIEAGEPEGHDLLARAEEDGFVLAAAGEAADLVARPVPSVAALTPSVLSRRELEIMDYLVDGWSNAEIASALGIGLRTVRFHLEGIFGKLGVSRRGEAVREAVRLGLVRFEA